MFVNNLMEVLIVHGDIVKQPVEVIVNAWNRNVLPWWLLLPQGVAGAIKREAGSEPFREVARHGPIPLGGAVLTTAGKLPYQGIIHVAGINLLGCASERSIAESVRNAMALVREHDFASAAFPVLGAGVGGFSEERALELMQSEFERIDSSAEVRIVRFLTVPLNPLLMPIEETAPQPA